ncbi:hypothetical protein QBC40DRAFT_322371 [Triangularia verruculosa]|uniref:Kelch repeat protein n=1 Tax=Triangularia verruculosa TaxID=2587418 RepID=A0AAN6XKQ2_9PEZI|nr:hypothetical protein QBC40DRAFT_322371 [Triangularia verruculosa]
MSQPWKSESVTLREIPRFSEGVQCRTKGAPWVNEDKSEFYIWGGYLPENVDGINDEYIWRFTADDSAAMVAHDKGYVLGGVGTWFHPEINAGPGIVTYDFKSKVLDNGTGPSFTIQDQPATLTGASLQFLPGYNKPHGLGLVLGGHALITVDGKTQIEQSQPLDLRNLTFFDPVTNEQYWQLSTGDIPPSPRSRACLAGPFRTPGGHYDLFLFGGESRPTNTRYDDAYVLSLPGFVWTKVPSPAPGGPRAYHSCLAVGKNQVVSIGGTLGGSFDADWRSPDAVPQGLLLFDMTSLRWRLEYVIEGDTVPGYERAAIITNWYQNGSLEKVQWSSEEVQKMFGGIRVVNGNASNTPPAHTVTNMAIATVTSGLGASFVPLPAILGGVGAALAVILFVVILSWLIIRSKQDEEKRTAKDTSTRPTSQGTCSETALTSCGYYVHGVPGELQGTTPRDHSESSSAQELDSDHHYLELMGNHSIRRYGDAKDN